MRVAIYKMLACVLLGSAAVAARPQSSTAQPSPIVRDGSAADLGQRIEAISAALAATQQQLEQSQRQMQMLQQELQSLQQQMPAATSASTIQPTMDRGVSSSSLEQVPSPDASGSTDERLQTLEAAVKLHDQTKVESNSKYPVRLTGLILFNGFLNRGLADNVDLPAVALPGLPTTGSGSLGAGFRQTILGIEGNGPRIAGARTSANVNIDFFSGVSYSNYGTSAGVVRMRTGSINFDWSKDSVQAGFVSPLISPLSPTSYANVAEPPLSGAGNLWTWAPQLRYAHQFSLRGEDHLQFEFGLLDSAAAGYNSNQLFRVSSPGESSQQPAYEARFSYAKPGDWGLQIGVGGYYSRESYPGVPTVGRTQSVDSWVGTVDWRLPFARHFEISGEGYRGRSLGGLGGGVYKDVIVGTNPLSGANAIRGLNAIGGWSQFKTRFGSSLETNLSIGQDNGFARDFHLLVLPPAASPPQLRARNKMAVGNLIFRPKTYIILSPEYRRIWTWPISGAGSTVDVFTLSIGYQF